MKIFVQIASYRDPELIPTIEDCLHKAKHPENLTFGICWQRDETEDLSQYENDPRFRILEYNWKESRGLCWARSLIQKEWRGEEYTLQLDSHHRFAQDWDDKLINMMKLTGSDKPLITSYAGIYNPEAEGEINPECSPFQMIPERFTEQGTILFRPWHISNHKKLEKPIPARFVSGHFYFTLGEHCEEYRYDPDLYFAGDEISLSIRSYTLGYDLFHPHETVVWHEYTRKGRTKHWTDHNEEEKEKGEIKLTWSERDLISKKRLRQLLREEENGSDLGEYGLGSVRSHHDYERYTGIDFRNRILHKRATEGKEPAIVSEAQWLQDTLEIMEVYSATKEWTIHAKWNVDDIPDDDYKFWYFGIEDKEQNILFRKDFTPEDDPLILRKKLNSFTTIISSKEKPVKWVLWVYSNTKEEGWANRIEQFI
jgi:hypothetical protein